MPQPREAATTLHAIAGRETAPRKASPKDNFPESFVENFIVNFPVSVFESFIFSRTNLKI